MSNLASGKFLIRSYVDYNPPIGADNNDDSAVKRVITDGQMKVWTIESVGEEKYKVVLEGNWYSSNDGNQVVVQTSVDPGTRWKIAHVRDQLFLIKSTDTTKAWTATEVDPKNPVILAPVNNPADPDPYQLWELTPTPED